jgi:hypothetical protein
MSNLLLAALALAMLVVPEAERAQPGCIKDRYGNVVCGPAGSHCLRDHHGEVRCSPPDGGILLDRYKTPVCGPGRCIADRYGDVVCSSVSKGAAALNINGDPVCTEGCVPASAGACVTPTK